MGAGSKMEKTIILKQFAAGSCYSYVLSSKNEAAIVDPHISLFKEYSAYLKKSGLDLKYIIDTHTHADHFSLAAVLKKEFNAPVLMHERAVSQVVDRRLKDNEEIPLGESKLKIIYSPGHTDDAISILAGGNILTADVLLIGSVGRTDFQNGSPESMFDTLQRIKSLPPDTAVYPGHDYHEKHSSTLKQELNTNPFLKETNKETFAANMRSKAIPKPFNIDNIVRVNQKGEAAVIKMISARDSFEESKKDPNVKMLDVRSVIEFSDAHIKGALNIPIDTLGLRLAELHQPQASYIVLCRTGNRSPMAADMLLQSGMQNVKVMEGGMTQWQKERLPVEKGVGGISIERQVRLAAGVFTLSGLLLAKFVHPGFIGISVFVACGLIFSGISDACFMAMLLMKLPYNKKLYKTKLGGGTCAMG